VEPGAAQPRAGVGRLRDPPRESLHHLGLISDSWDTCVRLTDDSRSPAFPPQSAGGAAANGPARGPEQEEVRIIAYLRESARASSRTVRGALLIRQRVKRRARVFEDLMYRVRRDALI
jgi:hypothetical protein